MAQKLQVAEIQFLVEQDGPPERLLKERLAAIFTFYPKLERAYLVQVQYSDEGGVALCLRCTDGQKQEIAEEIGEAFGSIFGIHEHLDILFVSENQESALRRVCRPFYSAPSRACA